MKLRKKPIDEIVKNDLYISLSANIFFLRSAEIFGGIPKVRIYRDHKNNLIKSFPEVRAEIENVDEIIMKGLHLSCPENMPIPEYLDIVCSNREKIANIVKKIYDNGDEKANISELRNRCIDLNEEVDELKGSKSAKIYDFITNFASQNKGTLFFSLIGGGAGSHLGPLGVFTGATLGGCTGDKVTKKIKFDVSKENREFLSDIFDTLSSRVFMKYFKKELPAIQLWQLQKRINK